jgi:solute carrier family 29 (equilibrative nucleoside transporter), member 4
MISSGYIVSFVTLIFVATCEVAWHIFSAQTAYSVNLAAVSLVAIGCTVQQSSFYGFAALLPKKKYTQALMAGESIAGFLVSSNRVATKLLIQSEQISTVIFFLTSTLYIAFSYFLHVVTIESPFIKYHLKSCSKIILRPDEVRTKNNRQFNFLLSPFIILFAYYVCFKDQDVNSLYGVLDTPSTFQPAMSFSNPVYDLTNSTRENNAESSLIKFDSSSNCITTTTISNDRMSSPTTTTTMPAFKVEHVLSSNRTSYASIRRIKDGFNERIKVGRQIFPYMVSIALAYLVTLSLYPGLETEIVSCKLDTWM